MLQVNYEVEEKKDIVQREISRELDKWESDNKPKVLETLEGKLMFV